MSNYLSEMYEWEMKDARGRFAVDPFCEDEEFINSLPSFEEWLADRIWWKISESDNRTETILDEIGTLQRANNYGMIDLVLARIPMVDFNVDDLHTICGACLKFREKLDEFNNFAKRLRQKERVGLSL